MGSAAGKMSMVRVILGSRGEDSLDGPGPRAGVIKAASSFGEVEDLALLLVSKLVAQEAVHDIPVAETESMVEGVAIDGKLEAGDVP